MSENPSAWDAEAATAEAATNDTEKHSPQSATPVQETSSPKTSTEQQAAPQQQEQAGVSRRKSMGDQKMEAALRIMKQSFIEAVGTKNWKSLFGEDIQITHSPEMETALKRLLDLHHLYNGMSKVLAQRLNALRNLAQADDFVFKYFSEAGIHEQDENLRHELVTLADQYKHVSKITQDWVAADQAFYDHVNTFFHKAIEDCVLTGKKYDSIRLEYDAFKGKLASLEQELATKGPNPKLERDIAQAKEQQDQVKARYDEICAQVLSKVEVLYDLKIKNLKEKIKAVKSSAEQYFGNGMRAFEVPDQEN